MTPRELHERVEELAKLAERLEHWIAEPTSDAPAIVLAGELADQLHDLERDLRCELLAEARA